MISVALSWLGARFAGLWAKLAVAGGVILAILLVAIRLISIGRRQERDAQGARSAKAIKEAKDIADEVHSLDRASVDVRLSSWMRDGGKR